MTLLRSRLRRGVGPGRRTVEQIRPIEASPPSRGCHRQCNGRHEHGGRRVDVADLELHPGSRRPQPQGRRTARPGRNRQGRDQGGPEAPPGRPSSTTRGRGRSRAEPLAHGRNDCPMGSDPDSRRSAGRQRCRSPTARTSAHSAQSRPVGLETRASAVLLAPRSTRGPPGGRLPRATISHRDGRSRPGPVPHAQPRQPRTGDWPLERVYRGLRRGR